jgi:hypothetical protein
MKYWEIIADNLSKAGWSWGGASEPSILAGSGRGMIGYPAYLGVCLCVPILPGRDFSAQAFHRNQAN